MANITVSSTLLATVKSYTSIDYEDDLLTMIISAAIEHIQSETGKTFDETSKLWVIAVSMLALHWFDNRGAVSPGTQYDIPKSLQSTINQIYYDSDYTEVTG